MDLVHTVKSAIAWLTEEMRLTLDRAQCPGGRLADIIFRKTPQLLIPENIFFFFFKVCLGLDKLALLDNLGCKIP